MCLSLRFSVSITKIMKRALLHFTRLNYCARQVQVNGRLVITIFLLLHSIRLFISFIKKYIYLKRVDVSLLLSSFSRAPFAGNLLTLHSNQISIAMHAVFCTKKHMFHDSLSLRTLFGSSLGSHCLSV
jgi:hypothetical protein